jgi:hypothetical protein
MGQQAYRAAVLADGPRAYYDCQDLSGLLQDTSGNGLHMTSSSGSPVYRRPGPDQMDGAYSIKMDGASFSRSQITGNTDFITFEFWYRPSPLDASNHTLVGNNNGGTNGYQLITPSSGHFAWVLQGLSILSSNSTLMTVGASYYIVATRNTTWRYYINANFDGAPAATDPIAPSGGTTSINGNANGTYEISNFAFYLSELSAAQVTAHYAAAQTPESSGYPISMPPHIGGFGAC